MSQTLRVTNMNADDDQSRHPLQHSLLPNPQECFRLLIFSPSHSGKSNLIKNIITRPEFGYNTYYKSNIFIFSQTIHLDSIWTDLKLPKTHMHDEYSDALITNIMHYSKKSDQGVLLILDDMITADTAINQKKSNLLKQLFFQGRHYKVSLILVSQKLKEIPASMRVNASHLICFNLNNRKEEKDFLEENSGIKDIVTKYKTATSARYNFLYLDKTTNKAYHNFEVELV
jgi:hypothetical protein